MTAKRDLNANNEIWRQGKGYIIGYTESRNLMARIKRYKPGWTIVAEYYREDKAPMAKHYRIPIEQRRPAERMFGVQISEENEAV